MDDDSTQKTLDALGDLYLTGTTGPASKELPKPRAARSSAVQLDGPAPLRFPRPASSQSPSMRSLTTRIPPHTRTQGSSRVEAVFLGNLPGFGGPWLTQYAHHLAELLGPIAVLHVDHEQIDLELVGTVGHRQQLNDLAQAGNVPVAQGLVAALTALTRPKLPPIGAWLVHLPMPLNDTSLSIAPDLPRWTMVCSSDQASIVGAYRWAKHLLGDEGDSDAPHRLGLMVMGCDADTASVTARKLDETAGSFLDTPVELVGSRKQMVPVELRPLGSFEAGPGLWPRVADFLESQATAVIEEEPAASQVAAPEPQPPVVARIEDVEKVQEVEQQTIRALVVPDRDDDEDRSPDSDTLDMDSDEVMTEVEITLPSSAIVEMPAKQPAATAESAASIEMNESVQRFVERLKHAQPNPPAASGPVAQPSPQPEPVTVAAAAPQTVEPATEPVVAEAPAPKPVIHQPVVSPPQPRPVVSETIEPLDHYLPADQRGPSMQARCPHHADVQLMVDGAGKLCLLLRHVSKDRPITAAMRDLEQTRDWARDHAALLQLTMSGTTIDAHSRPVIHLFTDDARGAAALVSHVGPDVRLHLLLRVTVGNTGTWYCTPLN